MDHPALTETTYYILLSLYHPRHGYGIMQETQQLSGGRVRLAAGTLYGARMNARSIADGLKATDCPLKDFLK